MNLVVANQIPAIKKKKNSTGSFSFLPLTIYRQVYAYQCRRTGVVWVVLQWSFAMEFSEEVVPIVRILGVSNSSAGNY